LILGILAGGKTQPWTCHDAELALWTFYLAEKFGISISPSSKGAEGVKGESQQDGGKANGRTEEVQSARGDQEDPECSGREPETKRVKLEENSPTSHAKSAVE
jgi:hypothetical protein